LAQAPKSSKRALMLVLAAGLAGGGFWWGTLRHKQPTDAALASTEQAKLSDEERLAKASALLAQPAQINLAMRRLELVSRSPELRAELQVWAAVALGTGYALRGEPARQTAALEGLPEALSPLWKTFALRLKGASTVARSTGSEGPLSPEEQAVFLLWQALAKISQGTPETALPLLQKASSLPVSDGLAPVRQLLSVAAVLAKDVGTLLALEREFLAPSKTGGIAARIQQAEAFQAGLHPLLAQSERVSALLQHAKTEPQQAQKQSPPPTAAPAPAPAPNPATPRPTPSAPPPQKQPAAAASEATSLEELRVKVPLQILAFQFSGAREKITAFAPKNEQQEAQKTLLLRQTEAVEALFRWCLQQINLGGTLPSPLMRNGAPFKSDPVRADERTLFVKPDANAPQLQLAWQEISPLFLIKILQLRGASLQSPTQRGELLWGAGTVHLLLGSKKSAAEFLDEAAKSNPAYRPVLQTLFAPESTP
jgi:hypothetical protein